MSKQEEFINCRHHLPPHSPSPSPPISFAFPFPSVSLSLSLPLLPLPRPTSRAIQEQESGKTWKGGANGSGEKRGEDSGVF